MPGSLSSNLGQPLARLSQISASRFPSLQLRQNTPPEASLDRLTEDLQISDQPWELIQRLIHHSMDSELFQSVHRRADGNEAQTALVRGLQKKVSAYAITQAQSELLGFPKTIGYG